MSTKAINNTDKKNDEEKNDYAGEAILFALHLVWSFIRSFPRPLAWLALWVFLASPTSEHSHWMFALILICIPLFILTILSRWMPFIGAVLPWRDLEDWWWNRGSHKVLYGDTMTSSQIAWAKNTIEKRWPAVCDSLGWFQEETAKDGTKTRSYPLLVSVESEWNQGNASNLRVRIRPTGTMPKKAFLDLTKIDQLETAWQIRKITATRSIDFDGDIEFKLQQSDSLAGVRHVKGAQV